MGSEMCIRDRMNETLIGYMTIPFAFIATISAYYYLKHRWSRDPMSDDYQENILDADAF